jgi:hypothetical protein
MDLHDYLIERVCIGPRRELRLSLRTPMNLSHGELRLSAIENYAAVEDWVQCNEEKLDAANEGRVLLRIDSAAERSLGSNLFEYRLAVDALDPPVVIGRRAIVSPT